MTFRRGSTAAVVALFALLGLAPGARADQPASHVQRAFAPLPLPGDLDVSFNGDGRQTTDFGGSDAGTAVAIQADGRIVVAGQLGRRLRARPVRRRRRA